MGIPRFHYSTKLGTGFATSRRGNDSWENAQWDYNKRKLTNHCINMPYFMYEFSETSVNVLAIFMPHAVKDEQ